jgi:Tfp pilus assembly protein PilF
MPLETAKPLALPLQHPLPRIPGYCLCALLGTGGMGVVYAAMHPITGQLYAIKLLRADMMTRDSRARFDLERRILERLNHPDIARLVDFGETADVIPYLVMEYVEGQTIVDFCELRKLDLPARVRLFRRVCGAVAAAHEQNIVHRDLKPANILVTADGRPKLLDFGIAKLTTGTGDRLTLTGCRPLTPEYASIEQIRGGAITPASDVYSLGVILAELQGDGDARLNRIITRATAEQPAQRYPAAEALAQDLDAYLEGRPLSAIAKPRPRARAALLPAVLLLGLLAGALEPWSSNVHAAPSPAERNYLVARHLWNKLSVPEIRKAETWFRKAVQQDSKSALAHAGLADALYFLGELGGAPPKAAFAEAKVAALRAIKLDDRLPLGHTVLANVLVAGDFAWSEAEQEFRKAWKLDSGCIRTLQGYGCFLMRSGRFAEAGRMIAQARLLDPASPILGVLEARISFYQRQYEKARNQLRAVLEVEPSFVLAHYYLAICHSYLGSPREAELEMRRAGLAERTTAVENAWLQVRSGEPESGLRLLTETATTGSALPFIAGELGRLDQAFALLDAAFEKRSPSILGLRVDPRYDPLRGDPRFSTLLARAHFVN